MKLRPTLVAFAPAMVALTLAASPLYAQDSNTRANQPAAQQQQQQGQQQQQPRAQAQQQQQAAGEKRAAAAGGSALTDGQVLQIVRTLNDAEIKQAEEASDEATNESVKQLADMIKDDHDTSNQKMDEILKGSLNMEDSDMNEQLADKAEATHEKLQDLSGAEYDCAYLQAQVTQHEEAIQLSKNTLMPNAKDASVKQFLTEKGPTLEHHLQMAKEAMGKVQGCSAPGAQSQQTQSQPAPRNQQ